MEVIKPITPLQVKKVSLLNNQESIETINNTKSAAAVALMEEIQSQDKAKIQSQNITLDDYSSDSSFTNHQLKVLKKFDLLELAA